MLPEHSQSLFTDQTGLNLISTFMRCVQGTPRQTCAATLEFILYQKHIPGSAVSHSGDTPLGDQSESTRTGSFAYQLPEENSLCLSNHIHAALLTRIRCGALTRGSI